MPPATPSVRDVETRLNDVERELVEFRAEGRIMFSAAKWLTALAVMSFFGGFYQIMAVVQTGTRMQVQGEQNAAEIKKIDERMTRVEERLTKLENRSAVIEQRLDVVERRLDAIDKRLDRLESKLDALTDLVRQALPKPAGARP